MVRIVEISPRWRQMPVHQAKKILWFLVFWQHPKTGAVPVYDMQHPRFRMISLYIIHVFKAKDSSWFHGEIDFTMQAD